LEYIKFITEDSKQNTQTLQLLTEIIKQKKITKLIKMPSLKALVDETKKSN